MIHINNIKYLGLSQYANSIDSIKLVEGNGLYQTFVKMQNSVTICPKCGVERKMPVKDYQEVVILHSHLKNMPVYLHVKKVRVTCPVCGKIFCLPIPFIFEDFPKMTAETLISILNEIKFTMHSFREIAANHWTSFSTVSRIFNSRVKYKNPIPTKYICIDEKCYAHGDTKFCLPILDFESNKLIDILKDRHKQTLIEWLRTIRDTYTTDSIYPEKLKQNPIKIETFSIDMSKNFYDAIKLVFPDVKVAVDRFHVGRLVQDALQEIRIKTMNKWYIKKYEIDQTTGELLDEDTIFAKQPVEYRALKKYWKILHLSKPPLVLPLEKKAYNIILSMHADPSDILDYLLSIDENLTKAWELKEMYYEFDQKAKLENASEWLDRIIRTYASSNLSPFIDLSNTLSHWKNEIVNSYICVNGRRITNGPMEGMNAKIEKLIVNCNGIPSFETLRERLLLSFGVHGRYYLNKIKD